MEPSDLFSHFQREVGVYFVSTRGKRCRARVTSTGINGKYSSFDEWLRNENDDIVPMNPLTNILIEDIFGYDVTLYDLQRFIRLRDMVNREVAIVATYMHVTGYLEQYAQGSFGVEIEDSIEMSCYTRFTLNDVMSITGKTIYLKG